MVALSVAPSPADHLAARLDDPATAESLNALLDHVDLLALIVTGLSEFVGRGDTITDTLGDAVRELKTMAGNSAGPIDPQAILALVQRGGALVPTLTEKLPVIEHALEPGPNGVGIVEVAAMLARAVTAGTARAEASDSRVRGALALLKALKDEDVSRAINFGLAIAKALGTELRAAEATPGAHRRPHSNA